MGSLVSIEQQSPRRPCDNHIMEYLAELFLSILIYNQNTDYHDFCTESQKVFTRADP